MSLILLIVLVVLVALGLFLLAIAPYATTREPLLRILAAGCAIAVLVIAIVAFFSR